MWNVLKGFFGGGSGLHEAIAEGDHDRMRAILAEDPKQVDRRKGGQVPLDVAIRKNDRRAVAQLLKAGADPSGLQLLQSGELEPLTTQHLRALLEFGLSPGHLVGERTLLAVCVQAGREDLARALLQAGSDPNAGPGGVERGAFWQLMAPAAAGGDPPFRPDRYESMVKLFVERGATLEALGGLEAFHGRVAPPSPVAWLLLVKGGLTPAAEPDPFWSRVLLDGLERKQVELVTALVEGGVDPNEPWDGVVPVQAFGDDPELGPILEQHGDHHRSAEQALRRWRRKSD